jgi:hypothetical protein
VIRAQAILMKAVLPLVAGILLSLAGLASPLSAATVTVYTLSDVVGSVTLGGTITTDGTLGVLTDSNITDFDVTFTVIGTTHITKSTNQVSPFINGINGTAVTATSGGLFFNYSGSGFISIFEQNNANWFMCASAGCTPHDEWFLNVFNVANGSGKLLNQSGIVQIAVGPGDPTGSTPLPAALPLFATGLGALGLLGWTRKRKQTATLPA